MAPKQLANWLGRPILDQEHFNDLERAAAVNEFSNKLPRSEAEAKAYESYKKDRHLEAAAHHLAGIKSAQAYGQNKAAQQHALLFSRHMEAAGLDPAQPVPPEVMSKVAAFTDKSYRFKGHAGDAFAEEIEHSPMVKSDRESCEYDPTPTTGKLCKNPRSRKVGDKYLCHWHADIVAKEEHASAKKKPAPRMDTPSNLVKSIPGKNWVSKDGLKIPHESTPARKQWDKAFHRAVTEHFGPGQLVDVDISKAVPRNPPHNGARVELYRKMAEKEGKLPIIAVEPIGDPAEGSYFIKDGNHRVEAAKQAGLTHLKGWNTRPGS